jgi:hypothetical protein
MCFWRKRIINKESDMAAGAGEGIYWKYESAQKKWDAELYSVVDAGELLQLERNTVLLKRHFTDDFIISLREQEGAHSINHDPEAYAIETASSNVKEEFKRKLESLLEAFNRS